MRTSNGSKLRWFLREIDFDLRPSLAATLFDLNRPGDNSPSVKGERRQLSMRGSALQVRRLRE